TDITVTTPVSRTISDGGNGSVVEVLTTGTPFHIAANDWPKMYHDGHNSSIWRPWTPVTTTATPVASANPVGFDVAVPLTAMVSSSRGTPTGSVTFVDGTTTLGTAPLVAGSGSFTTSAL